MTRYEIFSKSTLEHAIKDSFSPRALDRDFATEGEAKEYARNYSKNAERAANLVVCKVTYTPIFEVTSTFTTQEKDL